MKRKSLIVRILVLIVLTDISEQVIDILEPGGINLGIRVLVGIGG